MQTNNLTIKTQEAIQKAQEIARNLQHQSIENAHILKGILQVDKHLIPLLLQKMDVNTETLSRSLDKLLLSFSKVSGSNEIYFSNQSSKAIQDAQSVATELKDEFVSLEHLFLGIVNQNDQTASLLKEHGIDEKELKKTIIENRKGKKITSEHGEDGLQALKRFAIDLNKKAMEGKLDPVIGRDDEIRRILQILSRRTKNNPILIGEPGVGKTAIVEGIAHRIIKEDVPEDLKSKKVFALDMGSLIAGAKYKGEFEERLKNVVKEVEESNGEIILFIDEIHTLVGAGASQGAMDAANILKPALARGDLRAIGATTLNEYQKYFEKDRALERRFQIVMVQEPDTLASISILRGLKGKYEQHHKVQILDEAIISAVELSQRYITDRYLPDKAIDLIDEAASKLRIEINSLPEELEILNRKIRQLEIEKEAIKREKDQKKLQELSREIANLSEEKNGLSNRWKAEKDLIDKIQSNKKKIEKANLDAEQAERNGFYDKVAEIRYGIINELKSEIIKYQEELQKLQGNTPLINEEINAENIAEVVAKWTGIPVSKMLQGEKEKLLNLETELHKRVIGQDHAIQSISDAIRRSRAGLQDINRPIGSFIFIGSTGVGKTELAKALAAYLFNDENNMVRIDMSEYQEKHAVSRLIGAPPGYVGYDESGQLTEAVRRKPYSVVLLDEFEKAHPDVFNILLQVLDDGRLTDNKGRTVNFKNTIIILTSNAGSHIIMNAMEKLTDVNQDEILDQAEKEVKKLLKTSVRPEFLNRIDDILMFKPLTKSEIEKIVDIQVKQIIKRLKEQKVTLNISPAVVNYLAGKGYHPQYGARPVKRLIQIEILNPLSKYILAGILNKDKVLHIDYLNNEIKFSNT